MEVLELQNGQPMLYGPQKEYGIVLDEHMMPKAVKAGETGSENFLVHDEQSEPSAFIASSLGAAGLPAPIGVFRAVRRPTYDEMLVEQVETAEQKSKRTIEDVLANR